jgi:hypothetical protein
MLYSLNNQYPRQLPFRITLSNGTTRTDPATFTSEELADAGYVLVENPPIVNSPSEKLEWDSVSLTWSIVSKTEEELALEEQIVAQSARDFRNRLLSESDWTQVLDAPVDRVAWATYRQALRDITAQPGFPYDIIWPTVETSESDQ